jgi:uncharacterized membrane protein
MKKISNEIEKDSCKPDFYLLTWIFMVGSFLGYCWETAYYIVISGHYFNMQGVVYGPFAQIYGFGFVLLTIFSYRIRNRSRNIFSVFVLGAAIGTAFEYISSLLQEKILGVISWDYSGNMYNLNGRVELKAAIAWGVLGVIFVKYLYPWFCREISRMDRTKPFKIAALALAAFMTVNIAITVGATYRQRQRHLGIKATDRVQMFFDEYYPDNPRIKFVD